MKRSATIDLMKAIGIIAVVMGHYGILTHFVSSFHMPLFFIVGGYLYKEMPFGEELKRDCRRLLLPYALTCLVMLAIESVGAIRHGTWHNVLSMVCASFMGGGVPFEYQLFGYQDGIGAIWFLMALFVCRNIYNLLHKHFSKNVLSFVCLVLSIGAVYYFNHVGVLPWNIL